MKPLYALYRFALPFLLLLFFFTSSFAQCPDGSPQGGTAFDTTIATPEGVNTMQIKFPKFNPLGGMVTCVKLCITITGVVDSVSVENNSVAGQTANVYYVRTDQITGPGLGVPLSNSINKHYGPFALGGTDGAVGSGPDFISISHDTVLNKVQICRTLSDSTTIAQFYGTDSVAYTYDISAFTNITCTGGNYNSSISTSAFANFRFEYCTCPAQVLPLNIRAFSANKLSGTKVQLVWSGYDDIYANYHYEAEVSRDSRNFTSIGAVTKNTETNDAYNMMFTAGSNAPGVYYFRIKQVYSNGYVRYSNIKQVVLESSATPKFSIYPNPSTGIVGIKFDNSIEGQFDIQIYNTLGQVIVKKEIVAAGLPYVEVAVLKTGIYWLKLTDKKSQVSSVDQLLIK